MNAIQALSQLSYSPNDKKVYKQYTILLSTKNSYSPKNSLMAGDLVSQFGQYLAYF